jgi:hypothetical protein
LYACATNGGVTDCQDLSDAIRGIAAGGISIEKGFSFDVTVQFDDGSTQNPTAAAVFAEAHLTGLYNPDPFITFGTTTTNLVPGPTTYAFLFGTPIVPGSYDVATSTGGVTVTNGASGTSTVTTSAVYPFYISGYGTVAVVPTSLGVDLGTTSCVAGPGTPFTVTSVCSQGTTGSSFPSTFYDNLEALLTYTQDDVASVASWSGAVTIDTAVPEPALLTLVGAAIAGFAVRRRRTMRA